MQYNKHILRNLVYILFLTLFVSCSERVELNLENLEKLQLECILTPGQEITAKLSTVSNFSNVENIIYPDNARIYMINPTGDFKVEFEYNEDRNLYAVPVNMHTPDAGLRYEIRAYLKDNPDYELVCKTTFNSPTSIELINSDWNSLNSQIQLNTQLRFSSKLSNPFLKINTFYKSIDQTGSYSDLKPLHFVENIENPLSFYNNRFTDGIYINIDRVDYSNFSMVFNYPEEVSSKNTISDYIYFYTYAISEPVYRYGIAKAKHINAINGGNSDPVVTYTNIQNGYGVFGTSVGRLDSIKVK